jgi:(1->4)-alpha-D-glucan 1-alpha-D-glucosylmutase
LLATNTHDTKRSADVRSRVDALSELSREWDRSLRRWRRLNARHRKPVKGRLAPDTNTEYLIYQTLVALWPPPRPGRRVDDLPDRQWRDAVRERLVRYALKAAREAKTSTSWTAPEPGYEKMLNDFVAAILEPREEAPFLTDVARLVARVAPVGAVTSLARIVLHLLSPGTPDIYQGDELWNFTLVDPDNRAQVDYDLRDRLLGEAADLDALPEYHDNRFKLFVTSRLLRARRDDSLVFTHGSYTALAVEGPRASHVIAFARSHEGRHFVVVVPRLSCELVGEGAETWWKDTVVRLPADLRDVAWHSHLNGPSAPPGQTLGLADLLRTIPVAVLSN